MTNQPSTVNAGTDLEIDELSVIDEEPAWRPGSQQSGLDDRVEFARLGDQVAVRDPERPHVPALLLDRGDWEDLCSAGQTVDLRDR